MYILVGPESNGHQPHRVYIGEADEVRVRLDAHQKEKDFWTQAFVLSTTDDSLNQAHVRFLEARLLALARQVNAASIDNGTAPPLARLSEPEVADMESYLVHAMVQVSLAGGRIFDAPAEVTAAASPASSPQSQAMSGTDDDSSRGTGPASPAGPPTGVRYHLRGSKIEAQAVDDARGFIVLEGALGRADAKVMGPSYERLRGRLEREGVLVPSGNGQPPDSLLHLRVALRRSEHTLWQQP